MGIDPVTISIILGVFLSLNKPIGGWCSELYSGRYQKL